MTGTAGCGSLGDRASISNAEKRRPLARAVCLSLAGAMASVMATGNAVAAEKVRLGVEGVFIQYFGYASNNDDVSGEDFSGVDVKSDSDIIFAGETTLDNGLQFGAEVLLEAQSADDEQIDDSFIWAEAPLGRLEAGKRDNAAAIMQYSAPDVGLGINDSDVPDWVNNPTGGDSDSAFQSTYLFVGEGKGTKITYFTPRVAGFQVGLSYIPEFETDSNTQPAGDLYDNSIALGINYVETLSDSVEIAVAAGFITADQPDGVSGGGDAEGISFGLNLTFDAWTFGGSYASTDGNPDGGTNTAVSLDGSGFDIGVAYAFDPATVSLSYYRGEFEDEVAVSGDSTQDTVMLSASYELGPGVTALASLFHTRFSDDSNVDNEGTAFVTGLTLEF